MQPAASAASAPSRIVDTTIDTGVKRSQFEHDRGESHKAMSDQEDIARAFVDARRQDAVLSSYPGAMPATLAQAYAIQDQAIAYDGRAVGGWKLGRINPRAVKQFGAERLAGPIFANSIIYPANADPVAVRVLSGFAAVEAEVLLLIAATPPANLSVEDAPEFVSEVRFGIEVASSPFVGINGNGPAVTVSDFGNNFGLVVGPPILDATAPGAFDQMARLEIDGLLVGSGLVADLLDGPFGSLAFLARLMAERGLRLEPGQWISTGAITGVHPIRQGQHARAMFGHDVAIECTTAPALLPESAV
jgi:2-keto-4-pentenoate hydratase